MPDPVLTAGRFTVTQSLGDLKAALAGVTQEELNWRPAGDDTNSILVLATHVMHSTRSWLSVALGAPLPERDRDSEFRVRGGDPESTLAFVNDMTDECLALFSAAADVDWGVMRKTHARPGQAPEQVPAAWALIHAIEHLREHVAHISLTRQVWAARA